jgi:methyl-coenzyme M reductase subunit C
MEDFAKIGVKTKNVMPVNPDTEGTIVDIITGVVRGESATQLKIDETIEKIKNHLN